MADEPTKPTPEEMNKLNSEHPAQLNAPEPKLQLQTATLESTKPDFDDIAWGNLSLRGYIAFMVIATICGLPIFQKEIDETLKSIALVVLGFYFAKK